MDDVNPYAAPQFVATSTDAPVFSDEAWRDGSLLVTRRGAVLPNRCVKCNAAADGGRVTFHLTWHHPYWMLLLCFVLVYAVVFLFVIRAARIDVGLCRRHRAKQSNALFVFLGLAFVSVCLLISGVLSEIDVGGQVAARVCWSAAAIVFMVGIIALFSARGIWPARIGDELVWLRGVCPAYLDELPDFHARLEPIASPPRCGAGV
jgi:hypothetical protein